MFKGVIIAACILATAYCGPLEDYVYKDDGHYAWVDTGKVIQGVGFEGHVLNLTSQKWFDETIVDKSVWYHTLVVIVPHTIKHKDKALMYMTGGSNPNTNIPSATDEDILLASALALTTQSVTAALFQIPNEPVTFLAEGKRRSEDAIIAYGWNQFRLNTSNPEWLLRLPMTKAGVKAMDCMTEYLAKSKGFNIDGFLVAGASKRGWTTWTVAAVDKRVIAAVPIVMDLLNMHENLHHMWRNLGGWTFAFDDYYAFNFTGTIDDPYLQKLADIVDPFSYRANLTMPKLVIDSTGDEFFQPDDNHFWWDQMQGEIHLMMVQNAEHSMATGLPEVVSGISGFANAVLSNKPRPTMNWTLGHSETGGNITLHTSEPPLNVVVRHGDTLNGVRRDWRFITGQDPCPYPKIDGACPHPVFWHGSNATKIDDTTFVASFDNPKIGWTGFLIEVHFTPREGEWPLIFTTQVNIIPDIYAFPPCEGGGCRGTLL